MNASKAVAKDIIHIPPIDASYVPASKRILQIVCAVISCLLAGGVVFGFAAFKPVLVAEGVYKDRCTPAEITEDVPVCHQQEMKLNMMFTITAVATNLCALFVGAILDQYGPRVAGLIGSALLTLGSVGFGVSKNVKAVDLYPISYLLLGLAGPFIYISSMNLANGFPHRSGLILSLLTGAFDSSPAVFLVYRLLYQSTLGPITLRTWFGVYLIVPLFIFLVQLFIMPTRSYEPTSELKVQMEVTSPTIYGEGQTGYMNWGEFGDRIGETDPLLGRPSHHTEVESRNHGVTGAMHAKDVKSQICSFWFWGIAGFTIIQMLRINYFVASVRSQFEFLLHSYNASITINNFFDVALPIGGVLAIPFIGTFLDIFSMLTIISTLVICTASIGMLGLIQNSYAAAYLSILMFVAYRPFYYTVVSDYCVKVFGVATFGKVYGAIIFLAGFFNFSQAFLDTLTLQWSDGDPRPANMILLSLSLVTGITLVVFIKGKMDEARMRPLGSS